MTTLQALNAQMADAIKQTEYDLARYESALKTAEAELQQARARIADLEYRNEQLRGWLPDPQWDNAPEWAEWHAVDADGNGYWFSNKPRYFEDVWGNSAITVVGIELNRNIVTAYAPHSLTKRPTKEATNE